MAGLMDKIFGTSGTEGWIRRLCYVFLNKLVNKDFGPSGTESWIRLLCNSFNNLANEKDFAYRGTQNPIRLIAPVGLVVKPMKRRLCVSRYTKSDTT